MSVDLSLHTCVTVGADGRDELAARLELIEGFSLRSGEAVVELPLAARRLIAFLALRDRSQLRVHVAGVLWPDTTEERAAASLRSTLWRVRRMGHALVDSSWNQLRLAPHVHVDVRDAISVAHALLSPSAVRPELLGTEILLRGELLPDWYEEWALVERERFRQIRLHALERLAELLAEEGRMGEAIEAGLTAVASEPLRESAHRSLIRVFLREGNRVDAIRQFELFRRLIRSELGADPSPAMMELVSGFKGR